MNAASAGGNGGGGGALASVVPSRAKTYVLAQQTKLAQRGEERRETADADATKTAASATVSPRRSSADAEALPREEERPGVRAQITPPANACSRLQNRAERRRAARGPIARGTRTRRDATIARDCRPLRRRRRRRPSSRSRRQAAERARCGARSSDQKVCQKSLGRAPTGTPPTRKTPRGFVYEARVRGEMSLSTERECGSGKCSGAPGALRTLWRKPPPRGARAAAASAAASASAARSTSRDARSARASRCVPAEILASRLSRPEALEAEAPESLAPLAASFSDAGVENSVSSNDGQRRRPVAPLRGRRMRRTGDSRADAGDGPVSEPRRSLGAGPRFGRFRNFRSP